MDHLAKLSKAEQVMLGVAKRCLGTWLCYLVEDDTGFSGEGTNLRSTLLSPFYKKVPLPI